MNSTHQQPGQWHDVLVIPVNGDSYSHHMSYNIRNLEPGLAYEAIVQAKNRYGWNEVSDLYQFTTRGLNEEDSEYQNNIFVPTKETTSCVRMQDLTAHL